MRVQYLPNGPAAQRGTGIVLSPQCRQPTTSFRAALAHAAAQHNGSYWQGLAGSVIQDALASLPPEDASSTPPPRIDRVREERRGVEGRGRGEL